MRRLLVFGCCAAYLAFGFVAGAAHKHGAADHHAELRGLHLDHAHLGESSGHGPTHSHRRAPGGARTGAQHLGHHDGDALYVNVIAHRSLESGPSVVPATVTVGAVIDPPALPPVRRDELPVQLSGPPRGSPIPPRAPPV